MLTRPFAIAFAFLFLAGCADRAEQPQLSANHPASPDALEAPLPPASSTLAVSGSATAVRSDDNMSQMPRMTHDMGGMQQGMDAMKHDMHGMHDAPTTQPEANAARSAPQFTPTSSPATTQAVVYTCVMHPEVISDKPGKCPKCGMTLVKKGRSE